MTKKGNVDKHFFLILKMLLRDHQHMLHQPSSGEIIFNWDYFHINNLPSHWQFTIPLCKWISSLSITLSFCQWGNVGHERVGNLPRFVQPVARTRPSDPKQGHFHNTTLQLLPAFTGSWACKNYHKKLSQDIRAFRIGPAGTQSPQDLYTDTSVFSWAHPSLRALCIFSVLFLPMGYTDSREQEREASTAAGRLLTFSLAAEQIATNLAPQNNIDLSSHSFHALGVQVVPWRSSWGIFGFALVTFSTGWNQGVAHGCHLIWSSESSSKLINCWQNSFPYGCVWCPHFLAVEQKLLSAPRDRQQLPSTRSPRAVYHMAVGFFQSSSSSSLWLLPPLTF